MAKSLSRNEIRELYQKETKDTMLMSRANMVRYINWLEDELIVSKVLTQ